MKFIHDDFLLETPQARRLYHAHAEGLPLIDYHCHLSPREIAEDIRWPDIATLWLGGDHYKWRAMRTAGVEERFITGDASPWEKFEKYAQSMPKLLRNPLYHWSHLELARYFGIDDILLGPATAREVFDRCNEMLAQPGFSAREFMARARHRTLGVPAPGTRYQPMLELLDELRRRDFTVYLVSGGGTEFLRAISAELYGVPPETVVGTQVRYELTRRADGRPVLLRTGDVIGGANEGEAKVANIQSQLGRRPILAAGNSAGDREMLEWALAGDGPGLALLLDHDDREREFAYESVSSTLKEHEPITTVAGRLGWTVISMANDWSTVVPA